MSAPLPLTTSVDLPPMTADADGDYVEGDAGANVLQGGAGWDILLGHDGDDTIRGAAGDDYIEGGAGDDAIYGGEGHDVVLAGAGDDTVYGGAGHDMLAGNAGDDVLYGAVGNDDLSGGEGNDTLYGGAGDDLLYGDGGSDRFVFELDNGDDAVGDFDTSHDVLDLTAFAAIRSFDDLPITVTADGVLIDLRLYGGGTVELYDVELSDLNASHFAFAPGFSGPAMGPSSTWHMGSHTADALHYGAADDLIMALEGDDVIDAGAGDDTVHAGRDEDIVFGGAGDDKLYGYLGDDILIGGAGADQLFGERGDDSLVGGAGDDTLDGGFGDDMLYGGAGADTFVVTGPSTDPRYPNVNGTDTVLDFTNGEDQIDLGQLGSIRGFSDLSITADGTTAVIDLGAAQGGTLRLENTDVDDLDASDFIFAEVAADGF